jgi:hypothetical protein
MEPRNRPGSHPLVEIEPQLRCIDLLIRLFVGRGVWDGFLKSLATGWLRRGRKSAIGLDFPWENEFTRDGFRLPLQTKGIGSYNGGLLCVRGAIG